jgi:hypothetical protein
MCLKQRLFYEIITIFFLYFALLYFDDFIWLSSFFDIKKDVRPIFLKLARDKIQNNFDRRCECWEDYIVLALYPGLVFSKQINISDNNRFQDKKYNNKQRCN